jgi:hypothetical protein
MKVFKTCGSFCNWSCAKAYGRDTLSKTESFDRGALWLLKKRCNASHDLTSPIRAAPPRQLLKEFGGTMSREEFRDAVQKGDMHAVLPEKMIQREAVIEVRKKNDAAIKKRQKEQVKETMNSTADFSKASSKTTVVRGYRSGPRAAPNILQQGNASSSSLATFQAVENTTSGGKKGLDLFFS